MGVNGRNRRGTPSLLSGSGVCAMTRTQVSLPICRRGPHMLIPSVDSLLPREPITLPLPDFAGKAVVVTGSSGFIGTLVSSKLRGLGAEVIPFDLDDDRSVLRLDDLLAVAGDADLCLHLAADKHAPKGETIPAQIAH